MAHGHQHAAHEVHEGAACSADLPRQLEQCQSLRCCDDGTLTNRITDLAHDGRTDIRPDFRICESTLEIDCDLLANLTPHDANSPALGGVGEPAFVVAAAHNMKASEKPGAPKKPKLPAGQAQQATKAHAP